MVRIITRRLTYNRHLDRYVKRIKGKVHYFGDKGATLAEATRELDAFIRERDAQFAGLATNQIEVAMLAELYARACEARVEAGDLGGGTWAGYLLPIKEFVETVGDRLLVSELTPAHFRPARMRWGQLSPTACARYVRAIRTMFQWGVDNGTLATHPRYGDAFEVPTKSEHRGSRERKEEEHGERIFTPAELSKILNHPLCDGWLRTCILLALNAGMYAKDCSNLKWSEVKQVEGTWCITRTREKTKVAQRAPLWPETLTMIETLRRPGRGPEDNVFVTPTGGQLVNSTTRHDYVAAKFDELRKAAGIARHGVGFGSFRHTHTTAIGDVGDDNAARRVRGHEIHDVSGHYDKLTVERLKRVTDLARERLYVRILNAPTAAPAARRRKRQR